MNLETRAGYKAVSVLKDIVKEYIINNTENGKYKGELHYLNLYKQYARYLK
jgi:hypothetical protein